MDSFQFEITVLPNCCIDQLIKFIILHEAPDQLLLPEEKFCTEHSMIHGSRLKAVKSTDLLKTTNIMKQTDQLRKFHIFTGTFHFSGDLSCVFHHSIGMYDLQTDLFILPVVFIQIFFEFLFCMCNVDHSATPLLLLFIL